MVNKITSPITPLGEIDKINEVIDEVDKKLENTATGSNALTVGGTASAYTGGTNIGYSSQAKQNYGTALGFNANANGNSSTCVGRNAGASAASAIQIGAGVNSTANTLQVGFIHAKTNYQLLDGTTGKIPNDRLNTDTTVTSGSTKPVTSGAVYDALQNAGGGSSRNIGEIVSSTIPLTDAGLHLLDGALISGSGSYSAFVTYIAGLYNELSPQATTTYNVNTIGSLINTDGVLSEFSSTSWATLPHNFSPSSNNWTFRIKFKTGTIGTVQYLINSSSVAYQPLDLSITTNGRLNIESYINDTSTKLFSITGTTTLTANTNYYAEIAYNSSSGYTLKLSTDGETFTTEVTSSVTTAITSGKNIALGADFQSGGAYYQGAFTGTIDLNSSYITIGDSRWWTGTSQAIPCFCTEEDWQNAVSTYGVCGKFVYNSTNNTVRLPKYNSKIYTGGGTAPVVGNSQGILFTNGESERYINSTFATSGGYAVDMVTTSQVPSSVGTTPNAQYLYSYGIYGLSTDPAKSGIIAQLSDITTSLDGYYYIVVATSTKTDIQVDIDEIATDLNGKADVDLSNVPTSKGILTESYVNGTSWYRVYSDGWCEQGGSVVTTSANPCPVTLLKSYTNTNYMVWTSHIDTLGNQQNMRTIKAKTTSSFSFWAWNISGITAYWQACGYIR